jgi:sterol desaturase/sphingolipid hydroxylase (fatty acid hydroxylase superfamily)
MTIAEAWPIIRETRMLSSHCAADLAVAAFADDGNSRVECQSVKRMITDDWTGAEAVLDHLPRTAAQWAPYAAFWLVLFVIAAVETARPLRGGGDASSRRLLTNIGLGLINAGLISVVPLSTIVAAEWAADRGIGLLNLVAIPTAAAWVATILLRSLATYALHRLSHSVPILWRVHRIHHCDTAIDLSTGFRNHPLELAISLIVFAAAAAALGLSAPALAIYEVAAAAFAIWDHANMRLPDPLCRALRLLVVTPAMHHIHHSALRAQTDSNFGDVLSIWDRLFGTYRDSDAATVRGLRYGLGDGHDGAAASLAAQLRSPFGGAPI